MKPIFKLLNDAKIPYAVVEAYIKCKGITTHHAKDIFIIGSIKDSDFLRKQGFTQTAKGHDSVLEFSLSEGEVEEFKGRLFRNEFRKVQDNEHGKIYEPHTVNDFVAYCGGKQRSRPRTEPIPLEVVRNGGKPGRKRKEGAAQAPPLPPQLLDKRKTINIKF